MNRTVDPKVNENKLKRKKGGGGKYNFVNLTCPGLEQWLTLPWGKATNLNIKTHIYVHI